MTITTGVRGETRDDYTFSVTAGGRVTYSPPYALTLYPRDDSSNGLNITKVTAPRFTGQATPGDIVKLFDGQSQVGPSVTVGQLGTFRIRVSPSLADGNHTITATATDRYGDTSVPSASITVTIDSASGERPPSKPKLASESGPPGDNITNVSTPSFTGTAEIDSTSATVTLFDGSKKVGTGTSSNVDGTYTAKIDSNTPLADGTHTLTATTTDAANNTSPPSPPLTITVDTAAPTIDLPIATSGTSGQATGTLGIAQDDIPPVVTYTISTGTTIVQSGSVVVSGGKWTVTWSTLTAGIQYALVVTQTDTAGNQGSDQKPFTQ